MMMMRMRVKVIEILPQILKHTYYVNIETGESGFVRAINISGDEIY